MDDRDTKDQDVNIQASRRDDTKDRSSRAATDGHAGLQAAIGQRLRAYYDDVASEPVPDRFLALLDALDAAETSKTGSGNGSERE